MTERASPDVNASERSTRPEADTAALLEAEVEEAIATCGGDVRAALRATLVANAYLERTIDRSYLNGFRSRTDAQATSASEDLDV
jgi:hypothetical protein